MLDLRDHVAENPIHPPQTQSPIRRRPDDEAIVTLIAQETAIETVALARILTTPMMSITRPAEGKMTDGGSAMATSPKVTNRKATGQKDDAIKTIITTIATDAIDHATSHAMTEIAGTNTRTTAETSDTMTCSRLATNATMIWTAETATEMTTAIAMETVAGVTGQSESLGSRSGRGRL